MGFRTALSENVSARNSHRLPTGAGQLKTHVGRGSRHVYKALAVKGTNLEKQHEPLRDGCKRKGQPACSWRGVVVGTAQRMGKKCCNEHNRFATTCNRYRRISSSRGDVGNAWAIVIAMSYA